MTDANRYRDLPTVILGDFNTVCIVTNLVFSVLPFRADFRTPEGLRLSDQTLRRDQLSASPAAQKKLDWIWARNLEILEPGVQEQIEAPDHRPVWAQPRWRPQPNSSSPP